MLATRHKQSKISQTLPLQTISFAYLVLLRRCVYFQEKRGCVTVLTRKLELGWLARITSTILQERKPSSRQERIPRGSPRKSGLILNKYCGNFPLSFSRWILEKDDGQFLNKEFPFIHIDKGY